MSQAPQGEPLLPPSSAVLAVADDMPVRHNVFTNPDLLVQLLMSDIETGYKLVTFYTTSATLYLAIAGVMVQQYFAAVLAHDVRKASVIAWFGLFLSLISLAAPVGLRASRREIEVRAARYAEALGLPRERFTVVRFGGWLSLVCFVMICAGWTYLIASYAAG